MNRPATYSLTEGQAGLIGWLHEATGLNRSEVVRRLLDSARPELGRLFPQVSGQQPPARAAGPAGVSG